jgi:hypothetical protein
MALGTLIRGDDWKFTCIILGPLGGVQDITGSAVWLTFKLKVNQTDGDALAAFQVKNVAIAADQGDDPDNDPSVGVVILRAAHDSAATNPTDTTIIPATSYVYDIQYQDVATGAITTVESGTVTVAEQTTDSFL